MARNAMTQPLEELLVAVETTPRPTLRALMAATGSSSTSVVKYRLEQLAALGKIAITYKNDRMHVENGADFCTAWDMAARLAGNGEA